MPVATNNIEGLRGLLGEKISVTFVSGNFNVLHPGHMRLLKFAAELGDFLLVGVNMDSTPGVTVPGPERLANVKALSIVNEAVLLDEPAEHYIAKLKPAIVVKGKEFERRQNPEQAVIDSYGGRLVFGSGETLFSSFSLLDDEYSRTNNSSLVKPQDFPQRHGFPFATSALVSTRSAACECW